MATYYGSWGSKSQSWGTSKARLILQVTEDLSSDGMTEKFTVNVKIENNHSISYNLNLKVTEYREGSDTPNVTRKNSDVSISTPSGGATKSLYSYTSGDFSRFTTDRTIKITATLEKCTFYPQLTVTADFKIPKRDSWTVSYSGGGGTGSVSSQTKWRNTDLTVKSNGFTRPGYSFVNWRTSSGTTYRPGTTYSANAGTTMTAQWSPNSYTIIYNANGGSGSMQNTLATYGENVSLRPNQYTRTGYEFGGWATTNTATTAQYTTTAINLTTTNNGTVNLYAVWKPITYSIIYNRGDNGATGEMANSSHTYDVSKNLSRNAYIKTGYDFQHWKASSLNDAIFTDSQNVINLTAKNEAITLTAIWERHVYRESYDYKIDKLEDKYLSDRDKEYLNKNLKLYQNIPYDTQYQLPEVELSCYRIEGWYYIDENEAEIKLGNPLEMLEYNIAENRALYAKWELSGIPIYYYVDNIQVGTGNLPNNKEGVKLFNLPNFPGKKLKPDDKDNYWALRGTNNKYSLNDVLYYDNFTEYAELNFDAIAITNTTMKYQYIKIENNEEIVISSHATNKDYFEINGELTDDYICWKYDDIYYFQGDLFPNIATAQNEKDNLTFQFTAVSKEDINFIITDYKDIAEDFKQYKLNKTDEGYSYSLLNSLFYDADNITLTNQPQKNNTFYVILVNGTNKDNISTLSFPLQPNQQFEGWVDLAGKFITDNEGKIINESLFGNDNIIKITNLKEIDESNAYSKISNIKPKFNLISKSYIVKTEENTWSNLYTTMWVNNNNFSDSLIYPYKLGGELNFIIGTFEFNSNNADKSFGKGTLAGYKK